MICVINLVTNSCHKCPFCLSPFLLASSKMLSALPSLLIFLSVLKWQTIQLAVYGKSRSPRSLPRMSIWLVPEFGELWAKCFHTVDPLSLAQIRRQVIQRDSGRQVGDAATPPLSRLLAQRGQTVTTEDLETPRSPVDPARSPVLLTTVSGPDDNFSSRTGGSFIPSLCFGKGI